MTPTTGAAVPDGRKARSGGGARTAAILLLAAIGIILAVVAVAIPWGGLAIGLLLVVLGVVGGVGKLGAGWRARRWVAFGTPISGVVLLLFAVLGFLRQMNVEQRQAAEAQQRERDAAEQARQEAVVLETGPERTAALERWRDTWRSAETAILEDGRWEPRRGLEDAYEHQEELDRLCSIASDECQAFERQHIDPIRERTAAPSQYAWAADTVMDQVENVDAMEASPWLKWTAYKAWRDGFIVPGNCPDAVCTTERRRALERADRRMARYERDGRRWLQRAARDYRDRKARELDQTMIQSGIEGEVRAEGSNHDRLILRSPLCSRVLIDRLFNQGGVLTSFERQGFAYVGCRSHFTRYGWDLNPPPLESQAIIDADTLAQ